MMNTGPGVVCTRAGPWFQPKSFHKSGFLSLLRLRSKHVYSKYNRMIISFVLNMLGPKPLKGREA